jgi:predicted transcriptional regulator
MSRETVLTAITTTPLTAASIASLVGLDHEQVSKHCYNLVTAGRIQRVKVKNTSRKHGAPEMVFAYFVDEVERAGLERLPKTKQNASEIPENETRTEDCEEDDEPMPPADAAMLALANRALHERLISIANVIGHKGGNDGELESAVIALLTRVEDAERRFDDCLKDRFARNDALLRSPDAAQQNPGSTQITPLGWLCLSGGNRYETEAEARKAAEEYCTDPDLDHGFEPAWVVAIVAEATPIVAVSWRESA